MKSYYLLFALLCTISLSLKAQSTNYVYNNGYGLALYNNNVYITQANTGKISKFDPSTSTFSDVITGLSNPRGLAVLNDELYIIENGAKISKINLLVPVPVASDVITGLSGATSMAFRGNALYIAERTRNRIVSVADITVPNPSTTTLPTPLLSNVFGLAFLGDELYASVSNPSSIVKINVVTSPGSVTNVVTGGGLRAAYGLAFINNSLFIADWGGGNIRRVDNVLEDNPVSKVYATVRNTPRYLVANESFLYSASSNAEFLYKISARLTSIKTGPADKKTAILEQYTGVYCDDCPAAHNTDRQIKANKKDSFLTINIHAGESAIPKHQSADLRTSFGDTLSSQISPLNLPTGTINRRLFNRTTTLDPQDWAMYTDTVTNENSPVNIGMSLSVDPTNRRLTVNVELLYTNPTEAYTADSTNRLTVALLQDNVATPLISGTEANPDQIKNGYYLQHNVLRDFLTPVWGDTVKIKSGTIIRKKYSKTIPQEYANSFVNLTDLSVVAFIAKNRQNIFTGVKKHSAYSPQYVASFEHTLLKKAPTPYNQCLDTGSIQVSYKNKAFIELMSFNTSLQFKNSAGIPIPDIKQRFNGFLSRNDSTIASWRYDSTQIKQGLNVINIGLLDSAFSVHNATAVSNNLPIVIDSLVYIPKDIIATFPFTEDFETLNSNSALPENMFRTLNLYYPMANSNATSNAGALAASENAAFFEFYTLDTGVVIDLMMKKMDFSTFGTQGGMTFMYAKANRNGEADQLDVQISTDCGSSWTTVWTKSDTALNTTPTPMTMAPYTGGVASDWRKETVDLSAFAGETEVLIRFRGTSRGGQNLLLDDIKIAPNLLSTNNLFSKENILSIYPNPAKNYFTLSLSQSGYSKLSNQTVSLSILDLAGRIVYKTNTTTKAIKNNLTVSTNSLASGIYVIKLSAGSHSNVSKLVIN